MPSAQDGLDGVGKALWCLRIAPIHHTTNTTSNIKQTSLQGQFRHPKSIF
jgi:hypothetical protein